METWSVQVPFSDLDSELGDNSLSDISQHSHLSNYPEKKVWNLEEGKEPVMCVRLRMSWLENGRPTGLASQINGSLIMQANGVKDLTKCVEKMKVKTLILADSHQIHR